MINKVTLLGRLGRDPELKYTAAGTAVCNIALATSEKFKDKNGNQQERTEWHRCVIYGKTAELSNQYLKKGSMVCFEGQLQTRSWEKDSNTHYVTEVIVKQMHFIPTGGSNNQSHQRNQDYSQGGQNYTANDIDF